MTYKVNNGDEWGSVPQLSQNCCWGKHRSQMGSQSSIFSKLLLVPCLVGVDFPNDEKNQSVIPCALAIGHLSFPQESWHMSTSPLPIAYYCSKSILTSVTSSCSISALQPTMAPILGFVRPRSPCTNSLMYVPA